MLGEMIIPVAIALAIPLAFLYLVRWLDLYASGNFKTLLICLGWGIISFFFARQGNDFFLNFFAIPLFTVNTIVAPIVEEIFKSFTLVYAVRRPDFTYFVDGAIYGFAAGTGFALIENVFYLNSVSAEYGLPLAVSRAFSASLMHGSACALVGVALGRLRFGRGISRVASLGLGWIAAMTLHLIYNNVVMTQSDVVGMVIAVALGLGGVVLVAIFVFWGLAEERRWLRETLKLDVGVSTGESSVVQAMDNLDALLAPIQTHFGEDKRKKVESFLRLQAQLGLKRKMQALVSDSDVREELGIQIAAMRKEMDELRRAVGVYCMSYVRSILPPETEPMWDKLGQTLETQTTKSGVNLWSSLGDKMGTT
jgi:protease PrsW